MVSSCNAPQSLLAHRGLTCVRQELLTDSDCGGQDTKGNSTKAKAADTKADAGLDVSASAGFSTLSSVLSVTVQ